MQVNTLRASAFSTRSAVSHCEQHMLSIPVHNHGVKEYTFLISLIPPPWVRPSLQVSFTAQECAQGAAFRVDLCS